MPIISECFGSMPDGAPVELFTLSNGDGLTVTITNYGGIVVGIFTPDREGQIVDVALGRADFAGYLAKHPHFGALTGRVAGRLVDGQFTLDGVDYQLVLNNGSNHIHGGLKSFDKILWKASIVWADGRETLRLTHLDVDGTNGYPGNLECQVDYVVTPDNGLRIDYHFHTDKATPLAVTNHSYFNLKGEGEGQILDHELQIFASEVSVTDSEMTPLNKKRSVDGLADDFRQPAFIGDRVSGLLEGHGSGYFLPEGRMAEPRLVARVREPKSGRTLETWTTEPYLQFYTSSQMDDGEPGKRGAYGQHSAFCLETHPYSNSVNSPELGDGVLRPDQDFRSTTIYRFGVE